MLDTEMHLITFVIIIIQLIILPYQFMGFLSRTRDKSRLRALFLTLVFLAYNLSSGLLPDDRYIHIFPIFLQNSIAYSMGIIMAIYFVYYIYEEFNISPFKYFKIKTIIWMLLLAFILFFILPYLTTKDIAYTRRIFTVIPIVLALIFLFKIVKTLQTSFKERETNNDQKHYKRRVYAAYIGLISICFLPIITFFGDYQSIEQPVVNLGYFAATIAYITNLIYQSNLEYDLLIKNNLQPSKSKEKNYQNRFDALKLTNREKEIIQLILIGYSYKEISELLFITEKTVSKHSSNIFKKVGVNNIKDMTDYFSD